MALVNGPSQEIFKTLFLILPYHCCFCMYSYYVKLRNVARLWMNILISSPLGSTKHPLSQKICQIPTRQSSQNISALNPHSQIWSYLANRKQPLHCNNFFLLILGGNWFVYWNESFSIEARDNMWCFPSLGGFVIVVIKLMAGKLFILPLIPLALFSVNLFNFFVRRREVCLCGAANWW